MVPRPALQMETVCCHQGGNEEGGIVSMGEVVNSVSWDCPSLLLLRVDVHETLSLEGWQDYLPTTSDDVPTGHLRWPRHWTQEHVRQGTGDLVSDCPCFFGIDLQGHSSPWSGVTSGENSGHLGSCLQSQTALDPCPLSWHHRGAQGLQGLHLLLPLQSSRLLVLPPAPSLGAEPKP